ncbi:hypothetical protein [Mycolicibacterium pulveris]|uniref:hypothetical protein n=1 Tax=Mycolicibacterium pulveris TaxID=36813 RepID=UPI003CEFA124
MTAGLAIPSVHAIRAALEGVDGAIRDNPLPADAHDGTDPAVEIWMSEPDVGRAFAALDNPDPTIDDDVIASDGPAGIFEIPPEVTDADIEHVLGQDTLTEMSRLHEIRGSDAYGWYVTFHQRTARHGVHIPLEGALLMAVRVFHHLPIADERNVISPSTPSCATNCSISPRTAWRPTGNSRRTRRCTGRQRKALVEAKGREGLETIETSSESSEN